LAGGGAALALVSLRALLTVAQAGYLFAAFAAVALCCWWLPPRWRWAAIAIEPARKACAKVLAHWD
jgi:hypothetical protein